MFLDYLDRTYGSVDAYLQPQLGIGPDAVQRLREIYLR